MTHGGTVRTSLLLVVAALAACSTTADDPVLAAAAATTTAATVGTSTTTTATTTATATAAPATATTASAAPPPPSHPPRSVTEQAWVPFATVGGVTLLHPSSRVERVGFHESNHDGARQIEALPSATAPVTMETRNRETGSQTAADVVVDPAVEIRAPVTGTVRRGGTYVLYCDYSDDYVVIEPDDHPGWEVKVLHIDGLQVGAGNRVVAGETVLAPRPTQLPFESQVDELRTADPAWPHVHIEVVAPPIPDRPTPGGGCS